MIEYYGDDQVSYSEWFTGPGWYWWNQTNTFAVGPYETEAKAELAQRMWRKDIGGEMHDRK